MASLRNTLFMRLQDQRDAKAAQQQAAQQAALANTGQLAQTATGLARTQRTADAGLAQGLGQAAGLQGEPMPEMANARLQEEALTGYAPGQRLQQNDAMAKADKEQSRAAQFLQLKQQYEQMKAKAGKDAADLELDKAQLAETGRHNKVDEAIKWKNAQTGEQRANTAAENTGWRNQKLSPSMQKELNGAYESLGMIHEIRNLGNVAEFLVPGAKASFEGMAEQERMGNHQNVDKKYLEKGQTFFGNVQDIALAVRSKNFGKSQTGIELKAAAESLLQDKQSETTFAANLNRLERAMTRYVMLVNKGAKSQPATPEELQRLIESLDTAGQQATADTGVTPQAATNPNADRDNLITGVAKGLTPSTETVRDLAGKWLGKIRIK